MKKLILTIIAVITLCSLFFITGCTSNTQTDTELIPEQTQNAATEEVIAAPTDEQSVPDQLTIMAENKVVFNSGSIKYSPEFSSMDFPYIESTATAIVKATAISAEPLPGADKSTWITLTTIRIDEVILSDGSLKKGDERVLVEFYTITEDPDDENTIFIWSTSGSIPLKKNSMYLLYLQKPPQSYGDYITIAAWKGKYPITEKTLTSKADDLSFEDLEIAEHFASRYSPMAQQVFDKYLR